MSTYYSDWSDVFVIKRPNKWTKIATVPVVPTYEDWTIPFIKYITNSTWLSDGIYISYLCRGELYKLEEDNSISLRCEAIDDETWDLLTEIGSNMISSWWNLNNNLTLLMDNGSLLTYFDGVWTLSTPVYPMDEYNTRYYSITFFNSKIYCSTGSPSGSNGKSLYEYVSAEVGWALKAPQVGDPGYMPIASNSNYIYGVSEDNCNLYRWNGSNAWVLLVSNLTEYKLAGGPFFYNNNIYVLAYSIVNEETEPPTYDIILYEYALSGNWTSKGTISVATDGSTPYAFMVCTDGKLYATVVCGYSGGFLYKWNNTNAFEMIVTKTYNQYILSPIEYIDGAFWCGAAHGHMIFKYGGEDDPGVNTYKTYKIKVCLDGVNWVEKPLKVCLDGVNWVEKTIKGNSSS